MTKSYRKQVPIYFGPQALPVTLTHVAGLPAASSEARNTAARIIIENESHALVRRRSNIAHELGHHLLEHPFDQVILGEDHKRQFDDQQEKQATFMAGELLIPLAAAKRMAFDDWDNARVAAAYGVSKQFAQMQMKGPRVHARRAAQKYGFVTPAARAHS